MVKNYTFENDVVLKLNGVDFSFDSTDFEILENIEKFAEESESKAIEAQKNEDVIGAIKGATEYVLEAIDSILGEGASEKIWENKKVSLNQAVGVINHISEEVIKVRKEAFNRFSPDRLKR